MINKFTWFIKLFLLIIISFCYINGEESYEEIWRTFPACHMGRLQSPIKLNVSSSFYNNTFSFVYQKYKNIDKKLEFDKDKYDYAPKLEVPENSTGFVNFEKGGVIKQYKFIRVELYQGLHIIDNDPNPSDYEVHLIHKKVLGFSTNKNQYRSIQDANNYLVVVLRYSKNCTNAKCINDNGLLNSLTTDGGFNLDNYPIFQDKKAFYYEGSFIYNPCDEDVNYYVVNDLFKCKPEEVDKFNLAGSDWAKTSSPAFSFSRPIYRNFMNYTENLNINRLQPNKNIIILLSIILILL